MIALGLSQQFEEAAKDSKNLSERPSNDSMLQLYGLYKQATEGDITIDAPTNPFDFVGKAKYESWLSFKGKAKESAMQDYIDLVEKLKN